MKKSMSAVLVCFLLVTSLSAEEESAEGGEFTETVSSIPFPVTDEVQDVPVVVAEPLELRVLNGVSKRRYVEHAPEMPGTPGAKGMITVTMNLVEDPGLPDPPLPPAVAYDPDDPVVRARIDAFLAEYKAPEFVFVSATVWDHERTILRIYPGGKSEEAVTAVANLDFNHFSIFSSFRVTDGDGEYQDYNLMMGIGNSSSEVLARLMRSVGRDFVSPEFPEMLDVEVGGPDFVVVDGSENGKAAATVRRLHELYRNEGARMEEAYFAREAAREKRRAFLIANPPAPEDVTINFWRRSGPSNLEQHLNGEESAQ